MGGTAARGIQERGNPRTSGLADYQANLIPPEEPPRPRNLGSQPGGALTTHHHYFARFAEHNQRGRENMYIHRIYRFRRDGDRPDYCVISDLSIDEVRKEYAPDTLSEVMEIDGDATHYPCNRPLE